MKGHFLNLFDPNLPIVETVELAPASRYLLIDLDLIKPSQPVILASACKTLDARLLPDGTFAFYAEGPDKIEAVVRVAMPKEPKDVTFDGHPLPAAARTWHAGSKTLLVRFPNSAEGHRLAIH